MFLLSYVTESFSLTRKEEINETTFLALNIVFDFVAYMSLFQIRSDRKPEAHASNIIRI